eukprot:g20768.t1
MLSQEPTSTLELWNLVRLWSLLLFHRSLLELLRGPPARPTSCSAGSRELGARDALRRALHCLDRLTFGVFIISPWLMRVIFFSWHASCWEFSYFALGSLWLGIFFSSLLASAVLFFCITEPWRRVLVKLLAVASRLRVKTCQPGELSLFCSHVSRPPVSRMMGGHVLGDPTVADDVDVSLGRKKTAGGEEFETDHDRAKRIRRERRAAKEKEKDDQQKHDMNKAISALLGGANFQTFGPSGPSGPSVGPAVPGPTMPGPTVPGPTVPGPTVPGPVSEAGPSSPPKPGPQGPRLPQGPSRPPKPEDRSRADRWFLGPTGDVRWSRKRDPSSEDREPQGPLPPEPEKTEKKEKVLLGHMDIMKEQKRVSWDELKNRLAEANWKEAGVPGSSEFDSYSAKLEKTRNERLAQQEDDTKKALKAVNKGKKEKKKEKKKDKKSSVKRTADGAVLAQSSGESESEKEDALLARYKLLGLGSFPPRPWASALLAA